MDGEGEVGGSDVGGSRGVRREGQAVLPQDVQTQVCRAVEGVEVQGLVDVLVLPLGLAVGGAVVARVVQGVDLAIFAPRHKGIFLYRIQVLCDGEKEREREREQREGRERKKEKERKK